MDVNPQRVRRTLLILIAGVGAAHVAGLVSTYGFGHDWLLGLIPMFDLDREGTVPAWLASALLLAIALLLGLIGRQARQRRDPLATHWMALALLAALASLDESVSIHELWNGPLQRHLHATGMFYFAWVIPGIVGLCALTVLFRTWLASLPAETRRRLVLAAALYLSGALGVELLSGLYVTRWSDANVGYGMLVALEEMLELLGSVTAIHGLLCHMGAGQRGR